MEDNKALKLKAEEIQNIFSRCVMYSRVTALAFSFLVAMFVCGALVLLARFMDAPISVHLALLVTSLGACAATAICLPGKKRLSVDSVAALVDRESGAGGLIMELFEGKAFSGWELSLDSIRVPQCEIPWSKPCGIFIAGTAFVIACTLVPIPETAITEPPPPLDISGQVSGLKNKMAALEQVRALDAERKCSIEDAIKTLENNRAALDPGRIYESLDTIESKLQSMGAFAAEHNLKTAAMLQEMDSRASMLAAAPDEDAERRLMDFAAKFSEALQNFPVLPEDKLADLLKALPFDPANMRFNPGMLNAWNDAMRDCLREITGNIDKLRECQLCFIDDRGLRELLEGKDKLLLIANLPGSGGVDRGPGPAPLFFGPESHNIQEGKMEKLDGRISAPELKDTVGISFHTPTEDAVDDGGGWGALTSGQGSGGDARRHRISPHDRELIKKYFSK